MYKNDFFEIDKINHGERQPGQGTIDLRHCIDESIHLAAPSLAGKDIELLLDIAPDVPDEITGDEVGLRQVLAGLLDNAFKFTSMGEVTLTVEVHPSGKIVLFTLKDTGEGIPKERLDRLFLLSEPAEISLVGQETLDKLSLPVCKSRVEAAGGKIWVESDGIPGKGAAFTFLIPASNSRRLKRTFPLEQLVGKHLLLVDNHLRSRQALTLMSQELGLTPHRAASASDALELVQGGMPVDLALIDSALRDMDGLRLIRELRLVPTFQRVPVILMTPPGEAPVEYTDVTVTAWIAKPLRIENLSEIFTSVMVSANSGEIPTYTTKPEAIQPLRILLAEDDPTNQKVIQYLIKRLGYSLDLVPDGSKAIFALQQKIYDVILMDVQMPVMGGLEATRIIRRDLDRDHQPHIIAMTADDVIEDRDLYLKAGMDDLIKKPIQIDKLDEKLKRWHPLITQPSDFLPNPLPSGQSKPRLDESGSVINEAVLYEYVELLGKMGTKSLSELIRIYVNSYPTYVKTLETALDNADLKELRRAVHSIKSSSASMGAQPLSDLCKKLEGQVASAIENGASRDDYAAYRERLADILNEFQQVINALTLFEKKMNL